MTACSRLLGPLVAVVLALAAFAPPGLAADACKNRGELDTMYCDDNQDMVADVPTDPKKLKNPSTIVFTYTPVEEDRKSVV
jgi:phosphonate transport system substrate-binding protein